MNKKEFRIFNTQYVSGYTSYVAQYLRVTTNIRYLLFASEEKNNIYIARGSAPIVSVDLKIGTTEIIGLLPDEEGKIFLDISDIIRVHTGREVDMIFKVFQGGTAPTTFSYKIAVSKGRRFDELANYLSLPQQNFCNFRNLANLSYDANCSRSYILPPTKIIIPINENGTRTKFKNINNIILPVWEQTYGITNIEISQNGNIISEVPNSYSPLSINLNNTSRGVAQLRVIGSLTNMIAFEGFNDAQRYIAIRWLCPYIVPINTSTQGTATPYTSLTPVTGMAFFELVEIKQATNVISLENTANYMPNLITEGMTIKIGLKNLNAYDYVYYSQILLSDNIEYCLAENFGASASFTDNFQPAKVEKTNNIIPVGNGVYDLEIILTIKEND